MSIEAPQGPPVQTAGPNAGLRFMRYGFPVFLVMAAIFAVSQMSADAVNDAPSSGLLTALFGQFIDEIAHFSEYFVLSGLILRWILAVKAPPGAARSDIALVRSLALIAVGLAILYGVSDEAHQWFIDGRSVELADLLVDGIGATAGATIYLSIYLAWRAYGSRSPGRQPGRRRNDRATTEQTSNTGVTQGRGDD